MQVPIDYNGGQRYSGSNYVIYDVNDARITDNIAFRAVELTPETRGEMEKIKALARLNGTYLKAPNGADTKLTPEQWAMVRTKAFKDWFGDWENDPANASKVVDENGEPMVVYHGSGDSFTIQKYRNLGKQGENV